MQTFIVGKIQVLHISLCGTIKIKISSWDKKRAKPEPANFSPYGLICTAHQKLEWFPIHKEANESQNKAAKHTITRGSNGATQVGGNGSVTKRVLQSNAPLAITVHVENIHTLLYILTSFRTDFEGIRAQSEQKNKENWHH